MFLALAEQLTRVSPHHQTILWNMMATFSLTNKQNLFRDLLSPKVETEVDQFRITDFQVLSHRLMIWLCGIDCNIALLVSPDLLNQDKV